MGIKSPVPRNLVDVSRLLLFVRHDTSNCVIAVLWVSKFGESTTCRCEGLRLIVQARRVYGWRRTDTVGGRQGPFCVCGGRKKLKLTQWCRGPRHSLAPRCPGESPESSRWRWAGLCLALVLWQPQVAKVLTSCTLVKVCSTLMINWMVKKKCESNSFTQLKGRSTGTKKCLNKKWTQCVNDVFSRGLGFRGCLWQCQQDPCSPRAGFLFCGNLCTAPGSANENVAVESLVPIAPKNQLLFNRTPIWTNDRRGSKHASLLCTVPHDVRSRKKILEKKYLQKVQTPEKKCYYALLSCYYSSNIKTQLQQFKTVGIIAMP